MPRSAKLVLPTAWATRRLVRCATWPPAYVRKVGIDGYRRHPAGTGPYKFVEHMRDDHVTLQAWDGYWGGRQRIKAIIYRPIKEDAARVAALLAGEVDMVMDVPPELVPMIQRAKGLSVKMVPSARVFIMPAPSALARVPVPLYVRSETVHAPR